jgi:RimJ/RimL family protein N-acetyltransferase
MIRDGDRILTTRPGLTLRPERPDDEALIFRIFVASKALEFDGMPMPQFQKDFLLKQQHVSQLYNWRHLYPSLEQWIIESDGEPVGRLIFSNLPDQIIAHDLAMLPGRLGIGGGKTVIKDVIFAEAIRCGKIARASVAAYNPARRLYARLGVTELPPHPPGSPMIPIEWKPPALR